MAKKDFRLYCEEEYIDHLKMVADEKGTSVNQLVLSVLTKKYPMPKKKKDQTSTGPTLDIEATKKHYEALNQFLTEAENGGAKIKPYALYQHLVAERDRLKKPTRQLVINPNHERTVSVLSFFLDCRRNNQQTKTDRFTEWSAIKNTQVLFVADCRQLVEKKTPLHV